MELPENRYKTFVHIHFAREKMHNLDLTLCEFHLWSKKTKSIPWLHVRGAIPLPVTLLLAVCISENSVTDKMLT